LTEAHLPIGVLKRKDNSPQSDDVAKVMIIERCPGVIPEDKRSGTMLTVDADLELQQLIEAAHAKDDGQATIIFRQGERQDGQPA
jgi:hypothetical protein